MIASFITILPLCLSIRVFCSLPSIWNGITRWILETGSPESASFQVCDRDYGLYRSCYYCPQRTSKSHCNGSGSSAEYETEIWFTSSCYNLLTIDHYKTRECYWEGYSVLCSWVLMWFGKCVLILSESLLRSRAVSDGGHEKADPVQV